MLNFLRAVVLSVLFLSDLGSSVEPERRYQERRYPGVSAKVEAYLQEPSVQSRLHEGLEETLKASVRLHVHTQVLSAVYASVQSAVEDAWANVDPTVTQALVDQEIVSCLKKVAENEIEHAMSTLSRRMNESVQDLVDERIGEILNRGAEEDDFGGPWLYPEKKINGADVYHNPGCGEEGTRKEVDHPNPAEEADGQTGP